MGSEQNEREIDELWCIPSERVFPTTFNDLRHSEFFGESPACLPKVFHIKGCPTFADSLDGISPNDCCQVLRLNGDFLLIVIDVDESLKPTMRGIFEINQFGLDDRRAWIVQIISKADGTSMIFFNGSVFSYVYIVNKKITTRGPYCDDNRFEDFVRNELLRSSQSTCSLLDVKIKNLEKCSSNASDFYSKFLGVFQSTSNEPQKKKMKTDKFTYNEIRDNFHYVDHRGYNRLMLAIERQHEGLAKSLIGKMVLDLTQRGSDGRRAVDLAIDFGLFDVFLKLIEMDSPFPEVSNMNKLHNHPFVDRQVVNILNLRSEFFNNVRFGSIEGIKSCISKQNRLSFAYDLNNKCVLTFAMESKQFEAFVFLQREGFSKGVDPFYDVAFRTLTSDQLEQIASFNLEYFQTFTEKHIHNLIQKTKIASQLPDRSRSFEEIRKFYTELDEIPEVSEVFKVAALHESLIISIDFESADVSKMHPSQPENNTGVFFEGGYIYIAAGMWEKDRNEVLGLIAHEFTHCVMYMLYKNNENPYKVDDLERETDFGEIVYITKSLILQGELTIYEEKVLENVFTQYPPEKWPLELIVRVTHLLAKYKSNETKIEELKGKFFELFAFYETKILPDISEYIRTMKFVEEVKTLNASAGLVKSVENERIEFRVTTQADIFDALVERKLNIVYSNSTVHTLSAMFKHLDESQKPFIAMDLKLFMKQYKTQVQEMCKSDLQPLLILHCKNQSAEFENDLYQTIESFGVENKHKIFLIADLQDESNLFNLFPEGEQNAFKKNHKWEDLTETNQKKLLQSKFEFQGVWLALKEIIPNISCIALKSLPLVKFVGGNQMRVRESKIDNVEHFYVERMFIVKNQKENSTCEEIMDKIETQSVAIISGIAGTGKSTVLKDIYKKLKKMFLKRWVSYVDLKQHVKLFEKPGPVEFQKFFIRLASNLAVENENQFEKELFKQMYLEGNVLLLLDGFDEISPIHKEKVSTFVSNFPRGKNNQLWITTRSHLQKDLESILRIPSYQLSPFEEDEQTSFLLLCWNKQNLEIGSAHEKMARELVKRLRSLIRDNENFIGIPLLLTIMGQTYKDQALNKSLNIKDIPKNFNLFVMYKKFLARMMAIWRRDKGSLAENDQDAIDSGSVESILSVHQKLAVKHLLPKRDVEDLKLVLTYNETVWSNSILSRVGLVRFSGTSAEPQFLHRTFAEFFVAQYAVSNLNENEKKVQALKIFFNVLQNENFEISVFLDNAVKLEKKLQLNVEGLSSDIKKELDKEINWKNVFTFTAENLDDQIFSKALEVISSHSFRKAFAFRRLLNESIFIQTLKRANEVKRNILFERMKVVFSRTEIRDMFEESRKENKNVFLSASGGGDFEAMSTLIRIAKEVYNDDEVKSMLLDKDKDGWTILLNATFRGISKGFIEVFDMLRAYPMELCNLIMSTNHKGKNCLHYAVRSRLVEVFVPLLRFCDDHDSKELQKFFRTKDQKDRNVFLIACSNSSHTGITRYKLNPISPPESDIAECFSALFKEARRLFGDDFIKPMIVEKDFEGMNIVSLAVDMGDVKLLSTIFGLLKDLPDFDSGMSDLFLSTNNEGKHFLHQAALDKQKDFLEVILDNIKALLAPEHQKQLFKLRDPTGRNVFLCGLSSHYAKRKLNLLVDKTRNVLAKDEMRLLLQETHGEGLNIMSVACNSDDEGLIDEVLEVLREFFDEEEIATLLVNVS